MLLQSLLKIRTSSPGFSTHGVIHTSVDLVSAGYDPQRARNFQDELLERVKGLPGVESATFARLTPLDYGTYSSSPIAVDGYVAPPEELPTVEYNEVGEEYFVTMGIPLVAGREFTRADDEGSALVAVVNETMAGQYWRGKNPIGERVQVKGRWMQVVGVAKDSKYESVREAAKPFFYVPWRQNLSVGPGLYVRTPLSPETMAVGAGARGACIGRKPGAVRGDHAARASGSLDRAAEGGGHFGGRAGRVGFAAGGDWIVRRDVLCGVTEFEGARPAYGARR